MFARPHIVERRCEECGTAWLLTAEQAGISLRGQRRGRRSRIDSIGQLYQGTRLPRWYGRGPQSAGAGDEVQIVQEALRTCPKCQSENFTDRRITKSDPASPDASRTELPRTA